MSVYDSHDNISKWARFCNLNGTVWRRKLQTVCNGSRINMRVDGFGVPSRHFISHFSFWKWAWKYAHFNSYNNHHNDYAINWITFSRGGSFIHSNTKCKTYLYLCYCLPQNSNFRMYEEQLYWLRCSHLHTYAHYDWLAYMLVLQHRRGKLFPLWQLSHTWTKILIIAPNERNKF